IPIAGMVTGLVVTITLFRTVRYMFDKKMEARGLDGGEDAGELRERIEYLEHQVHRLEDIEDRLDFAERLLSKGQAQGDR
ncbi:MAG: hypothetical protein OEZ54_08920, partial [Gemmatimonadota bacterium]|nr:hypothetical protein [Gemmatimonadota bacterium]